MIGDGGRRARPWLAALLSLLAPGMGHLYAWRGWLATLAWLCFAGAVAGLIAAFLTAPSAALLALALVAFGIVYIAIAAHAYRTARVGRGRDRLAGWIVAVTLACFYLASMTIGEVARRWIRRNVTEAYGVRSGSMEPTILGGDWLLSVPRRRRPLAHDALIVYRRSGNSYVKRVVGLPGDTLSMRDQRVFRNGRPLIEPYAFYDGSRVGARAGAWGPLEVPAGGVFVMGDNRNNTADSRYFGFVAVDSVVGHPVRIYFSRHPTTGVIRWGRIGHELRSLHRSPGQPRP